MVNLSFDFAQDSEDVRLSGSTVLSGSPSKDSVEALVELLNHIPPGLFKPLLTSPYQGRKTACVPLTRGIQGVRFSHATRRVLINSRVADHL